MALCEPLLLSMGPTVSVPVLGPLFYRFGWWAFERMIRGAFAERLAEFRAELGPPPCTWASGA